jgi:3-oxoacyl-[acyl-carrier protein] reductase
MKLSGKTALVTGAARGIGFATAQALVSTGARVCMADIDTSELVASKFGYDVFVTQGDVSNEDDARRIVQQAANKYGPIDIVVNCAGIMIEGALRDMKVEDFDRQFAVNVRGTFLITQAALPELRVGKEPTRIINIASELFALGRPNGSAYVGTKGAVVGLTRCWARELAPHTLVNAIAPGATDTPMLRHSVKKSYKEIEQAIPLGRIASASEIASSILWLAGPASTYVTGQTIGVTGGAGMF